MIRAREPLYVDPRLARAVTVPPPWPRRALLDAYGWVIYADSTTPRPRRRGRGAGRA